MTSSYQNQPQAVPPLDWPHYGISFPTAITRGFKKYATFTGRASLSEYWWWTLYIVVAYLVLGVLSALSGNSESAATVVGILAFAAWAGILIPSLAVTVRRLHDTGRSGWYYLLTFIPLVGGIILLVFLVGQTTPQAQEYGPPYLNPYPQPGYSG